MNEKKYEIIYNSYKEKVLDSLPNWLIIIGYFIYDVIRHLIPQRRDFVIFLLSMTITLFVCYKLYEYQLNRFELHGSIIIKSNVYDLIIRKK